VLVWVLIFDLVGFLDTYVHGSASRDAPPIEYGRPCGRPFRFPSSAFLFRPWS